MSLTTFKTVLLINIKLNHFLLCIHPINPIYCLRILGDKYQHEIIYRSVFISFVTDLNKKAISHPELS